MLDLFDFKQHSKSFEEFAGFYTETINFGSPQGADRLYVSYVTANFFSTLGIRPVLGRSFAPTDDQPGAEHVVIVSNKVWKQRLGGDPAAIGKTIHLDGKPFTVIGVMLPRFRLYTEADVWLPFGLWPYPRDRASHWALYGVARLRPGVTLQAAQAELDALARQLAQQYPETNSDEGAVVLPLKDDMISDVRPALLILLAAVGLVLLIACVNVANLLLARGAARQREIAIRSVLGANPGRIVRQLLTESLLIALLGGTLGLLLAVWVKDFLPALGAADIPRIQEVSVDHRVLMFSLAISLVATGLSGLAPSLQAIRQRLVDALKVSGRATGGVGRRRLRSGLVVSEISLALILLAGAGLLIRSLAILRGVNPGYNPDHVLALDVSLSRSRYYTEVEKGRFAERVLERLRTLPGVERAAAAFPLPVDGNAWGMYYWMEGQPKPAPGQFPLAATASVSPSYLATLEIRLLKGRDFTAADTQNAPGVVIVDETLARRAWPGENPIGKHLSFWTLEKPDPLRTVVGVVGSVKNIGLAREIRPQVYIPYTQQIQGTTVVPFVQFALRTRVEPKTLAAAAKNEIAKVDLDAAISSVKTLEERLDEDVSQQRFSALLLGLFSALALVLAAIGIYGVMAYGVTERTQEIGIRIAMGAQPRDVLKLVIGNGLRLAALGIGLGLPASFALTRLLASQLYGVSPADPVAFAAATTVLVAVALLACYVPARRATKVDPMVALRYE